MAIEYHALNSGDITDAGSYEGQLWLMLCQFECKVGGTPDTTIYDDRKADADPKKAHNPTIGVGFNLRAQLLPVMRAYFGQPSFDTAQSSTSTQDKALIAKLNGVMGKSWDGDANVSTRTTEVVNAINAYYVSIVPLGSGVAPQRIADFSLTTGQIQTAFKSIKVAAEKEVSEYATVPESSERLALMSLAWNGGDKLLGKGLRSAIQTGDRVEAWFEVRYNSNGGSDNGVKVGIAKRRYFESQLFGLYNEAAGTSISEGEASQIYAFLSGSTSGSGNRKVIFDYENLYSKQVAAANTDYHSVLGITALTLQDALQPAADALIQHYVTDTTLNPWAGTFANTTFDALDVQVAARTSGDVLLDAPNNHDLVASKRDDGSYQLGTGKNQNSLLIAQDGSDTLDGTGTGNDALIGGTGNDTILGGSGNDYIVAGTGNDSISLTGGNDTVALGQADNLLAGGQDTVYAQQDSGLVAYYIGAGTHETIYLNPNVPNNSTFNLVSTAGGSATPFSIAGQWLAPNVWVDPITQSLLIKTPGDSSTTLNVFYKGQSLTGTGTSGTTSGSTTASTGSGGLLQSLANLLVPTASASDLSSNNLARLQANATATPGNAELTLYNFNGTSSDGITLGSAPSTSTPASGASDLSSLDTYLPNSSPYTPNYYGDDGAHGSSLVDSIYGSNTTGETGNRIVGFGNASFIYAGDGDNTVVADNPVYDSLTGGYDNGPNPNLYIEAGTGNQVIWGALSGHETIQGGNAGPANDLETIYGANADAFISLGSEDGIVFGGTGADTLNAGGAQTHNVAGSSTLDAVLFAGLTNDQNGQPITRVDVSAGALTSEQIYLDGTALLGSSLDSGDAGSSTLPGSLLIGGTGNDLLVGNAGNDTIIGGTESVVSSWTPTPGDTQGPLMDDILIGGAGNNLIVAGNGHDGIFADMSPVVSNWADLDPTSSDTIYGGGGYDQVYGSGGNDYFYGGSGDFEVFVGNGASHVYAGSGATSVFGGSGGDYIAGGSGADQIVGGKGSDTILAGSGASFIVGGGGNDYINGGTGNDYIFADNNSGNDSNWANDGGSDSVTIDGGSGNDTIYGSGGPNLIFAGSGNDAIVLGNGTSTVDAGSGSSDTFYAGSGDETYAFSDNGEQDGILNPTKAASIALRMHGMDADELTFANDGHGDLVIGFGASTVTLAGYIANGESNVSLAFDNGSSLGAGEIAKALTNPGETIGWGAAGSPDTITGGAGNATLSAISGNNVLIGGGGNSTILGGSGQDTLMGGSGINLLHGGSGAETYVFQIGNGSDTIVENSSTAGTDTFQFGAGIAASDVQFGHAANSNDLVIRAPSLTSSTSVIAGFFAAASGSQHQVGTFVFTDGTSLSASQVTALASNLYASDDGIDTIQGGSANTTIYGGSGRDTLIGGSGNALIVGGSGIELIKGGTGHNTLIGGSGNDTIDAGTQGDLIETGTGGTSINGGVGNDTVDIVGGQSTIQASSGSDLYDFGIGSGQATLQGELGKWFSQSGNTSHDVLLFGTGITASDLTFTEIGSQAHYNDALVVGIKGTKDSFTINDYFYQRYGAGDFPLAFQFQDGSSLNQAQVVSLANDQADWNGAADLSTSAAAPSNVFSGGTFELSDGALTLNPSRNLSPANLARGFVQSLSLGQGIRPQDVMLQAQGDSALLRIKGTSDSLYLPGLLDTSIDGYALTSIVFDDGTTWDLPTTLQHVAYGAGTGVGQLIPGQTSGEVLTPSGPNDTIHAISGDTVHVDYGDGQTVLSFSPPASGGVTGASTLLFGPDVSPGDISISTTAFATVFTLKRTGETITVDGQSRPLVKFADGNTWDSANISSLQTTGYPVWNADNAISPGLLRAIEALPAGTQVIFSGTHGGTLEAGPGNSFISFGDGFRQQAIGTVTSVTYNIGDGNVTMADNTQLFYNSENGIAPSSTNSIQFGQGLSASDVLVSRSFTPIQQISNGQGEFRADGEGTGALVLTIQSTGHTVTIPYVIYMSGGGSGPLAAATDISGITFQDGGSMDLSSLILGGGASLTANGVVVGSPGSATLSGAAGDTIDAAEGNTVVLGNSQAVYTADNGSTDPSALHMQSTYLFNASSNGDTVTANIDGTLEFAPGITESDVGVMRDDAGTLVYLKDTGAYVIVSGSYIGNTNVSPSANLAFKFSDGQTYTVTMDSAGYTGVFASTFVPTTPLETTDTAGQTGIYAVEGGLDTEFVRGHVTNAQFDGFGSKGNLNGGIAFDAAAGDVTQLSASIQSGIDPSLLSQPVTLKFDPSMGRCGVTNYDPNGLIIQLPDGVTASDIRVKQAGMSLLLFTSIEDENSDLNGLNIDGFYSGQGGAVQEKPFEIHFADGTVWNSDQIVQQGLQDGGIFTIASPTVGLLDLSHYGDGQKFNPNNSTPIQIANVGQNEIELGKWGVDATYGYDTFVVTRNSSALVTHFDAFKDAIQFSSDIDPSDIEVSQGYADAAQTSYSYAFILRSTGKTLLTVSGSGLTPHDSVNAFVQFANGVTWSSSDMTGTQAVSPSGYYTGYNGYGSANGLVVSHAIRGGTGNQLLSGGAGDDAIAAGVGNDTLDGGGGHDTLYGGVGSDTFLFGHGSGYDTIVAGNDGIHINTLAFKSDVAPADVSVVRPSAGNDLELRLNDTGETVLLPNFFGGSTDQAIQSVTFTDGTQWDVATLIAKSQHGSAFSGYLQADASDESIAGGNGNDTILGDYNTDTLRAGSGNDLIQSGDGTNTIIAGAGFDTIHGGRGSDMIIAGAGSASIYGGTGAETYQFGPGFGQDTIVADGAGYGSNIIRFVGGINPNDVTFSLNGSGDMVISVDGSSSSILLPNHVVAGVTYSDVDNIEFANGTSVLTGVIDRLLARSGDGAVHYPLLTPTTVLTAGPADTLASDNGNDLLEANADADTLTGGSGADTLVSGAGSSLMTGGSGFETYQFNPGFGHDTLVVDAAAISNSIQFTGAIAPWNLTFSSVGANLLITVAGSVSPDGLPSTILLPNHFVNGQPQTDVGQIVFGDGSVITMAQVNQQFHQGGSPVSISMGVDPSRELVAPASGSDTLLSDNGDDTLIGGGGTTTMIGGGYYDWMIAGTGYTYMEGGIGNETYEIDPGAQAQSSVGIPEGNGQTVISTNVDELWTNAINFGGDITLSDLTFTRTSGTTLEIVANDRTSSEEVSVLNYFDASGKPTGNIQAITFSDGEQLSLGTVNSLIASAPNKTVQILPSGINALEASPWSGATGSTIVGGVAIDAFGSTTLSGVTGNDAFTLSGGGDSIDLGSGQSIVNAQASDNVILLGSGNNLIEAAGNSQSYVANAGFGNDTINGNASSTLSFGAGIRAQDIRLQAQGSDQIISDTVGGSIDLQGWYGNATSELQSITFADGSMWTPNPAQPLQVFDEHLIASAGNESLTGTAGNDTLTSDGGSDTLVGGVGATTMVGGAGNDLIEAGVGANHMVGGTGTETYEFGQSFGQTTISASPTENGADVIQFAPGVSSAQLSYTQSGSDLDITVTASNGTTSTIAVANHFVNGAPISSDLSALTFADGSSVSITQINQQFASSAPAMTTMATSAALSTRTGTTQAAHATRHGSTPAASKGMHFADLPSRSDLAKIGTLMGTTTNAGLNLPSRHGQATLVRHASAKSHGSLPGDMNGVTASPGANDNAIPQAAAAAGAASEPRGVRSNPRPNGEVAPALNASTDARPGTPKDPIASDANDATVWAPASPDGDGSGSVPLGSHALPAEERMSSAPLRGVRLNRTANAANEMIKALIAQGTLQGAGQGGTDVAQIKWHDGTQWSLSTLDQALAAWTPATASGVHTSASHAAFGSAALAHAQLVNAMASFNPAASADSTLPPTVSEAYAITLAVQMH